VLFEPHAIETAVSVFNALFPDNDGVLGLGQSSDHHPTGVALIGSVFLNRYPGRQPFYPKYWHFAAQEIEWLAKAVGRFHYDKGPFVRHVSPYTTGKAFDSTHHDARLHKDKDRAIKDRRKAAGQIWGLA